MGRLALYDSGPARVSGTFSLVIWTRARAKVVKGILAIGLVPLLLGACGTSSTITRGPFVRRPTKSRSAAGGPTVTTGAVRATLTGQDHSPVAKQKWIYTLSVTDAQGHPLAAMIDTEFSLQGAVVGHDTPPTHFLKNGRYKEALKFPATSVGVPLDLQVVVHTKLGSVTLDWPVTVSK